MATYASTAAARSSNHGFVYCIVNSIYASIGHTHTGATCILEITHLLPIVVYCTRSMYICMFTFQTYNCGADLELAIEPDWRIRVIRTQNVDVKHNQYLCVHFKSNCFHTV